MLIEHGNWIGFYPNEVSRESARASLGIAADSFVCLFFGLCKPYKNLEHLVRSHRRLRDDSLLWIVGRFQSPAYRTSILEAAAEAEARTGSVTIRDGLVDRKDIQIYMNACDAVVLPYREILTSGAVMVALSFGRPVVAPRIGSLVEVVTPDCGVLYDPDAEGALVDAIRAVQSRRYGPERIMSMAAGFSWDRSAAEFARRVLEQRR
ncbi:MAG: glycosyltransferase [Steroidobacteraceae bacterium]